MQTYYVRLQMYLKEYFCMCVPVVALKAFENGSAQELLGGNATESKRYTD